MCVHSAHGGEVGLHSLHLFVCVICAAYFSAAQGDCTDRPYLPTCGAKADALSLRLRNENYLHVLYASQVAQQYAVVKPRCKQASLGNSTRSLRERGVEPLGSPNNSCTMRISRGLPINASYACTSMHCFVNSPLFLLI